ncbi:glycosyl transferase [Lampropedia puyangensis]|uniref:Glycosyl transferase n=1 Tax=Lampropedia puyangensis TaxID=1330072 RepID=A0A4S8F410_9BURK|nr:glycosyltransferase [Lampropedia puyangensis]THU01501.1 glycosyl transferase [Lampropedia puyangensis]
MLWPCVIAFFVSFLVCGLLRRMARRHARRYPKDMPQRQHKGDIPRIGGVAMAAGMGAAICAGLWSAYHDDLARLQLGWWVIIWGVCMVPAVLGGLLDDLTQKLTVRWRFLLTFASAALAVFWLGIQVPRIGIPWIDQLPWLWPWLGIAIALFAIAGLPHAFNIIDGYNGLACMVAIIVALALTHVSIQVNDRSMAVIFLITAAASGGFLLWNYPLGRIFAGDCGAYLWGSVLAIGSVLLVQRHPSVSPWFPILLLIYPVWETLFSMYRKWARGGSPGVADALHIHQLIYRRIVQRVFDDDEARDMLKRNNRTSPYLWGYTLLTVLPAVLFWHTTWVLILFCLGFSMLYTFAYLSIIRFKVPVFLRWNPLQGDEEHPSNRNEQ